MSDGLVCFCGQRVSTLHLECRTELEVQVLQEESK